MDGFVGGLLVGASLTGLLAALLAAVARRRLVLLERRTRDAERLAELGTLTGGLAHEIKNPLSTVQLNLQLLQEDLGASNSVSPRVLRRLATVKDETTRLRDILDDFLRYAGRIELERKPTELSSLLEELVDFLAPRAELQRVTLRLDAPPIEVPVDARLLKQALLNLMLNALQVMPNGGELMIRARAAGRVTIEVTDTGPGIPPDDQRRIFDAYYSKRRGGTGLGLAMTRRIVQEHGGTIELYSEPGKGSTFRIHLPARSFDAGPRGA